MMPRHERRYNAHTRGVGIRRMRHYHHFRKKKNGTILTQTFAAVRFPYQCECVCLERAILVLSSCGFPWVPGVERLGSQTRRLSELAFTQYLVWTTIAERRRMLAIEVGAAGYSVLSSIPFVCKCSELGSRHSSQTLIAIPRNLKRLLIPW